MTKILYTFIVKEIYALNDFVVNKYFYAVYCVCCFEIDLLRLVSLRQKNEIL